LDAGEKVYSLTTADKLTRTASITIPSDATVASTRMRVAVSVNMTAGYNGCGAV